MCAVMSGYSLLSNLACEQYICFCVGLSLCPGLHACRIFVMLLELVHAVPLFLFLLDTAMPPYRVVLEALRDPVAFELILVQREGEYPDGGHGYASELVEVFRKIHTYDPNFQADAILDIMTDLEVRLDHAEGRLGEWVCGWLEASLQVSWDCWSIRFNEPFYHLYRNRLTQDCS
jgi:hypothetical protein